MNSCKLIPRIYLMAELPVSPFSLAETISLGHLVGIVSLPQTSNQMTTRITNAFVCVHR